MTSEDIRTLYDYNRWANHRVCEAARSLQGSDLVRDLRTSYSSVQGTLVHILWGEWLWVQRWRGESPKQVFAASDFPSLAELEARWRAVEREQEQYIAQLSDQDLRELVSYENLQGQRWEYTRGKMMQHVVNHSSYHRGQVATLLRQMGKTPNATDFLMYFDEAGPAAA
ncbi:MAG: DinB family protein [Terriglobales bacterium]